MWKLALDCKVIHAFGEEGWRPVNERDHEHWEPNMVYVLLQYWDEDTTILGIFPSIEKLYQCVNTLDAKSANYYIEWQEWDLEDVCTKPKRKGQFTVETKFIIPKELT